MLTGLDMNYVSVVYAVVVVILLTDWFIRGRKSYRGVQESQVAEDVTQ